MESNGKKRGRKGDEENEEEQQGEIKRPKPEEKGEEEEHEEEQEEKSDEEEGGSDEGEEGEDEDEEQPEVNWDAVKRFAYYPIVKRTHVAAQPNEEEQEADQEENDKITNYDYFCGIDTYDEAKARVAGEDYLLTKPSGLTRFGGARPSLLAASKETWPLCDKCQTPLVFMFQLHTADLPPTSWASDPQSQVAAFLSDPVRNDPEHHGQLLQCFYCCECGGYEAFSEGQLVRMLPAPLKPSAPTLKRLAAETALKHNLADVELVGDVVEYLDNLKGSLKDVNDLFCYPEEVPEAIPQLLKNEWTLIGWRKVVDYPHTEELEEVAGVSLDEDDEEHPTLAGTKLGGWPHWCQSVEYPSCSKCGEPMKNHLLQMEEDELIPFMWGDSGTAQITQCNTHKEVVGLTWACC